MNAKRLILYLDFNEKEDEYSRRRDMESERRWKGEKEEICEGDGGFSISDIDRMSWLERETRECNYKITKDGRV